MSTYILDELTILRHGHLSTALTPKRSDVLFCHVPPVPKCIHHFMVAEKRHYSASCPLSLSAQLIKERVECDGILAAVDNVSGLYFVRTNISVWRHKENHRKSCSPNTAFFPIHCPRILTKPARLLVLLGLRTMISETLLALLTARPVGYAADRHANPRSVVSISVSILCKRARVRKDTEDNATAIILCVNLLGMAGTSNTISAALLALILL